MSSSQSSSITSSSVATTSTTTVVVTPSLVADKAVIARPRVAVLPPRPIQTLAGKVAIVTGASRGIGASIATYLARDGANVVVNYNSSLKQANEVIDVITTIGSAHGSGGAGRAVAIKADTTQSNEVDFLFAETKRIFGRIDIVIANTGIFVDEMTSIEHTDEKSFDKLVNGNLRSAFLTYRAAARSVESNGRIIGIGSNSYRGIPNAAVYGMTKAALSALGNSLAAELAPRNITVNTLHPGPVATDMTAAILEDPTKQAFVDELVNQSLLKRVGTVDDIGAAVALFVSNGSAWITAQDVMLTGGGKPIM